jgi:formate dehydrogenase major subunit
MSDTHVVLNGVAVIASPNDSVLALAEGNAVTVPHVCFQENLGAIQTCDTCIVSVDGKLVRACATTLTGGESIETETPEVVAAQREAMSRILRNHELYCTVCENNNGNCVIHNTFSEMGMHHSNYEYEPKPYEVDATHSFYRYDPDQCILCGRCVEACQDFQVNETLSIDWSLDRPRVVWDGGVAAGSSSCVGCGHCVTVCPCNALMEKSMLGRAGFLTALPPSIKEPLISLTKSVEPATGLRTILALSEADAAIRTQQIARTKTVCTYCGVGCSFEVWTREREILKVEPTSEGPANAISTCVKGKFGWDYVNSEERITSPLIRRGDHFEESSWDEALAYIGERMGAIRAQSGPDALGFIASSKCTNEESYLMQKLARAVVGTHNVDNCSRYCQSPATMGLWRTVGFGGDSGSISDIAAAGLVIIVGSNTAESHPVIATRVKRAHKLHGQKLIVADIRRHEMAERADIHLHPVPGTDQVWLAAVTKYLLDNDLADWEFLERSVSGLDAYRESLAPFTPAYAEEITGISAETIAQVAQMIAASDGTCVLWAMGVTQHQRGSDTSTAISNLLLVSGNYGRPGAGAYPLRGHNNVQGASDFGSMPAYFSGYQRVDDAVARRKFEEAWEVSLPTSKGLDNHEMVDAIHEGSLKSLYLIGEDMGLVDSNALYVQAAFEKLDFFVVQDLFFSKTASFADVILPASPSLEKDGTFTNTERRIQRINQAIAPLGQSKPDWQIIQMVANELGGRWSYSHPSEIMDEAARLSPLFAGVSYDRLVGFDSLQWPVAPEGVDSPLLYLDGFAFEDKKARLYPLTFQPPSEEVDEEYDLHLNNGRLLEHFHEGNMTYRSSGIAQNTPDSFVEVSPELASARGVQDGSLVRLVSRRGAVRIRVIVTDRVSGNELYMPMNSPENESAINVLTSSHTDVATHTPAYKELAVRMEVLSVEGRSPLPKSNFRYGVRNPQRGVMVEKKWARADYRMPPAGRGEGGL